MSRDPLAEFMELGKAIARANPEMSYEQTIEETVRRHPDAYARVLALRRRRVSSDA